MAIGLGDIYDKLKELVTITDKVRENTDEIKELKKEIILLRKDMEILRKDIEKGFSNSREEFRASREETRLSDSELRGDIKAILSRLDVKDEISALKVQLAEHIAVCEKVKA
jgi:predicted  nucleic acid-binding Zn-ribbon protein